MFKKFFSLSIWVFLLTAGQALAQQASYVTNSTVTMETDGTNPDGSVNLQTNNAGRINFFTNRTLRGYIDGTTGAITGLSLANPTISGNLTFSSATAKIIPGVSSLSFRNAADDAANLVINNNGDAFFRTKIYGLSAGLSVLNNTSDGADNQQIIVSGGGAFNANGTRGAAINLEGNELAGAGDLYLYAGDATAASIRLDINNATGLVEIRNTSDGVMWDFDNSGNINQNTTGGGDLKFNKSNSAIRWYGGGHAYLQTQTANNMYFGTNTLARWQISSTGTLEQDPTNGNNIVLTKASTGFIYGASSLSASYTSAFGTAASNLIGAGASQAQQVLVATGNDANAFQLRIAKTRASTDAATTIVQNGDITGDIQIYGADGSAYRTGAVIRAKVDGTPGASDMPMRLEIYTTPDGSATPNRRWYFDAAGNFASDASNTASILANGQIISSRATDLGWAPVNAPNQACNTTCTNACVFGMNTGALGNFVGCADATADTCICAGAS